ncbi:hypothetical protein [uncultured Maribacter sp.]|uniref:hypothetical protein n=1 Tax=uncultured Maribacter sp. TaxID=431308 RepID=UPI00261B887C|nr:hypothetical protein [uncultured Maribacter sp.]
MFKEIIALTAIVLFHFQIQAQSLKSKAYNVYLPNYAEQLAPKQSETYLAEVILGPEEVLNFTKSEFKKALQLEDFKEITGDQSPDLFFAINGISENDLEVTGTIAPVSGDTYSINISPKDNKSVKLLFYYNEKLTQLWQIPLLPQVDVRGNKIPTTINFKEDEKEKYLMLESGRAVPDISPYMVEMFLDKKLGKTFINKIVNTIQGIYDNNMEKTYTNFYYIKDKKNSDLSDESKEQLTAMSQLSEAKFSTLIDARASKSKMEEHIAYWKGFLPKYEDTGDKKIAKIRGGILMNLYQISLMTENFNTANSYLQQAADVKFKSSTVKQAQIDFAKLYANYKLNYNETSGERKYSTGYETSKAAKVLRVL